MDFIHDTVVNVHGYRASFSIEPEVADANSNGIAAIWVLPGGVIQNADMPNSYGLFGDEKFAPYLWGLIPWTASNQTPFTWEFAPKTSRNIQRDGRILFQIFVQGTTSGLNRLNTTQTCFTSQTK